MARPPLIADYISWFIRFDSWPRNLLPDTHWDVSIELQDITGVNSRALFDVFPSLFYPVREKLRKLEEA